MIVQRLLKDTKIIYDTDTYENCVYVDRKPLWIPLIIDYMRGYTIDVESIKQTTTNEELQILYDDLQFYGLTELLTRFVGVAEGISQEVLVDVADLHERVAEIFEGTGRDYLEVENEQLYHELLEIHDNAKDIASCEDAIIRAEQAIKFAEFKEYFISSTMRIVGGGLSYWKENAEGNINVPSLKESIENRLMHDDELLTHIYDFADSLSKVPFLSWVVDSVKMFIVHYFMHNRATGSGVLAYTT
jgi:hypothetical protein